MEQELTLKDFKSFLNGLTEEELNQPFVYNSKEYSISGRIKGLSKAKNDLYWKGDDDPSTLFTKAELKNDGYDSDDIKSFTIEIKKGDIVIEL